MKDKLKKKREDKAKAMKGKVDEFKKSKEDYAELTGRLEAIEEEGRETGKKPNRMCGKGGKGKGEKAADGEKPAERPADSVTKTEDAGTTKTATTEDGSVTVEAGNGLRALRFLQRTQPMQQQQMQLQQTQQQQIQKQQMPREMVLEKEKEMAQVARRLLARETKEKAKDVPRMIQNV